MENNYVQSDLRLLLHEYAESLIMQGTKVSYENAHYILDTIYGWERFYLINSNKVILWDIM